MDPRSPVGHLKKQVGSLHCVKCSLWAKLSCSSLSLSKFQKISPGHSWTCPKYLSPQTSFSPSQTFFFSSSLKKSTPKNHSTFSTTANSSYLPNQSQLISTYPPSASSLFPSQPQPSFSFLTRFNFHHSPPSPNCL